MFQNTIIKLIENNSPIKPLTLVYAKRKYYVLKEYNLTPLLINQQTSLTTFTSQNQSITTVDILDILKNLSTPKKFTFNIYIYTSYKYTQIKSFNHISKNLIGNYVCPDTKDTLHLFISPFLINSFVFHVLPNEMFDSTLDKLKLGKYENLLSSEGIKNCNQTHPVDKVLNQEFCVCEHRETQQIFLQKTKQFSTLGKSFFTDNCSSM
jgi:hypothetical protein